MSLKIFKPYTKSSRGTVLVSKNLLWKGKSFKSLTLQKHKSHGRNNNGRITSRHIGGGHKQKYRSIDFFRKKDDVKSTVERIEYDPNRSAHVALVKYEDGAFSYILAPNKIKIGDEIVSGRNKEINTINLKGKSKMVKNKKIFKPGYKKAIITLKKGQSIDLATGV